MKLTNKLARVGTAAATVLMLATTAFASGTDLSTVSKPIIELINSIMGPLLGIVLALSGVYCIILGVKFAKAEEPQEREKAKTHLKNAIIGFVIIFVLILALNLLTPILANWVNTNSGKHIIDTNGL